MDGRQCRQETVETTKSRLSTDSLLPENKAVAGVILIKTIKGLHEHFYHRRNRNQPQRKS